MVRRSKKVTPEAPKEELFKIEETPLGKKAKEFLAIKSEQDAIKEKVGTVGEELIALMKKENRSRIKLETVTISVTMTEAKEKIKIEQVRD